MSRDEDVIGIAEGVRQSVFKHVIVNLVTKRFLLFLLGPTPEDSCSSITVVRAVYTK